MGQLETNEEANECTDLNLLCSVIRYLRRAHSPRLMMIKFVIVQSGNYKPFKEQCLRNTTTNNSSLGCKLTTERKQLGETRTEGQSKTSALERMLSWEQFARKHCKVLTCLNLYILIKYRLVAFASSYENLEFLDCFILGRFHFVGRANKISLPIGSVFMLAFLTIRALINLRVPKFKFFAFEFLLGNYDEVLRNELRVDSDGTLTIEKMMAKDVSETERDAQSVLRVGEHDFSGRRQRGHRSEEVNSIFYLQSPFELNENKWILRPNRGSKSWRTLNMATIFGFYSSAFCVLAWFAGAYWTLSGSVISSRGFEMSYPTCVTWLRDLQLSSGSESLSSLSFIYLAPKVLAHEIPIDNIPARIPFDLRDLQQLNLYGFARVLFDMTDIFIILAEYVLAFTAIFHILIISSLDIVLNANAIKKRLESLLEKLNARAIRSYTREKCYLTIAPERRCNWLVDYQARDHFEPDEERLSEEIDDLQAILVDHFDSLTSGYNQYTSFILAALCLSWLSYTIIVCTWMSSVRSRTIEMEFLTAESSATFVGLLLISCAVPIRSHNLQLYPLITRAMALDSDRSPTKLRWLTILNYYFPKPIYCFTVFGAFELSPLLCLKLSSWIISGFVLLANFFYMNKL